MPPRRGGVSQPVQVNLAGTVRVGFAILIQAAHHSSELKRAHIKRNSDSAIQMHRKTECHCRSRVAAASSRLLANATHVYSCSQCTKFCIHFS
jgi:hypothetical protein